MSNKIGILSDIHGNYDALEAVMKNAKKRELIILFFVVIWLVIIMNQENVLIYFLSLK